MIGILAYIPTEVTFGFINITKGNGIPKHGERRAHKGTQTSCLSLLSSCISIGSFVFTQRAGKTAPVRTTTNFPSRRNQRARGNNTSEVAGGA